MKACDWLTQLFVLALCSCSVGCRRRRRCSTRRWSALRRVRRFGRRSPRTCANRPTSTTTTTTTTSSSSTTTTNSNNSNNSTSSEFTSSSSSSSSSSFSSTWVTRKRVILLTVSEYEWFFDRTYGLQVRRWVFTGFYWVLQAFTGFYQVLLGFYHVLLGFTRFNWV